ncbi:MAG TPA: hypothetical protein PLI70_05490 [Gemmatimonadales bacterium]|nr:hypothetical protein [Gemmatimonadales bacterium]HRZ09126.1 hypothetical protein [Gemmatimonadales bacterium]
MLHVTWGASVTVPSGELVPESFDGELRAGLLLGIEPKDEERLRVDAYGSRDELARLVAAAICLAHEHGYLPAALGYAARMNPGAAAYVLRGQVEDTSVNAGGSLG